jgi:ribose/xylose/arabinose/galactoside ABC-type transport system permease subunit
MKVRSEGIGIDRKGRPLKGRSDLGGNPMFLVFAVIAVLVVGGIITDSFVDAFNLSRVFRQMAIMGLMAIGMTYVIIGGNGGIDLSVGSSFGLAAMISISLQNTEIQNTSGVPYSGLDLPLPVILLAVIGAGMLMGLANGVGVAKLKLPPFIMTMSTLSIGRGICLVYSNGFQFVGVREDFQNMGGGMIGDVFANTLIIFIVAVVISYFVLHKAHTAASFLRQGQIYRHRRYQGKDQLRDSIHLHNIGRAGRVVGGVVYGVYDGGRPICGRGL